MQQPGDASRVRSQCDAPKASRIFEQVELVMAISDRDFNR